MTTVYCKLDWGDVILITQEMQQQMAAGSERQGGEKKKKAYIITFALFLFICCQMDRGDKTDSMMGTERWKPELLPPPFPPSLSALPRPPLPLPPKYKQIKVNDLK